MELYDLYCKFPRILTDSRQVVAGGIFFALHGETFDGNRYAAVESNCNIKHILS